MKSQRWQLMPGFDPLWHDWEDEVVVFDRFSGNTHFLDTISAELIRVLMRAPLAEQAVMALIAESQAYELDADFADLIRTRLQALAQLGVVGCLTD